MRYEANIRMTKNGKVELFTEPSAKLMEQRGWVRQDVDAPQPTGKVKVLKEEPKIEEIKPDDTEEEKPKRGRKKKA